MAVQTGRTVAKWCKFRIDDSGGTIRDIPIDSINGVGLTFEEVDLTAFQDAIRGVLLGQPDLTITIGGPFDTTAAAAPSTTTQAAALSGSHTILSAVNGGNTPLGFAFYIGVRHYWEAGEPVFGIAATSANGVLVTDYQVMPEGKYSAKLRMVAGSAAPAWGTADIT